MKRHIKVFEEFAYMPKKGKEIAAGLSYMCQGEDWSVAESGFPNPQEAGGWLQDEIRRADLEGTRAIAWVVYIKSGAEMPEPNFDTSMGEVLLEGSYEPIMIIDLSEESSEYGAQYNRSGEIYSKGQAIQWLTRLWDSYQ